VNHKLSIALRALAEHSGACAEHARLADAAARYLSELTLPSDTWGEFGFSSTLDERWAASIDARSGDLAELHQRIHGAHQTLRAAAEAYADVEDEHGHHIRVHVNPDSASADAPGDARGDLPDATHPGPDAAPVLPDPTVNRDCPGGEALLACREENLSTLKRAEDLLDESGRLDFTAPSVYLRRLAGLRPGAIGGRSTALTALSSALDTMRHDLTGGGDALADSWEGASAESFAAHNAATGERLDGVVDSLAWHASEAEELWRLLDGLARDVAEAVWGRVETVGASRITRIRSAVSLVEDARGYTLDAPAAHPIWGSLSDGEMDAAVQVLYKRVWYLANAMSRLVADAGDSAAQRLDPAHRPPADAG
jgi:uncharacterized protein YukE